MTIDLNAIRSIIAPFAAIRSALAVINAGTDDYAIVSAGAMKNAALDAAAAAVLDTVMGYLLSGTEEADMLSARMETVPARIIVHCLCDVIDDQRTGVAQCAVEAVLFGLGYEYGFHNAL